MHVTRVPWIITCSLLCSTLYTIYTPAFPVHPFESSVCFLRRCFQIASPPTCVEVEDAGGLALHGDGHVVPLDVGRADMAVRQLHLEEAPAALKAVQREVAEPRLDVRLVGVEGLVEDVLHDLRWKKPKPDI